MRDLVVFVADLTMEKAIETFLTRPDFHRPHNLHVRPFDFDPRTDLIRIPGNDAGVFTKGHEWVRDFGRGYRHAVLVFDREYGTDADATALRNDLCARVCATGWDLNRFCVVVIDPELEAWIWQRNQRVAAPLKFESVADMVAAVRAAGLEWGDGQAKPLRPKEALQAVVRQRGLGWSSAIHRSIIAGVSLVGCQDPAFVELRGALQGWFPAGGAK